LERHVAVADDSSEFDDLPDLFTQRLPAPLWTATWRWGVGAAAGGLAVVQDSRIPGPALAAKGICCLVLVPLGPGSLQLCEGGRKPVTNPRV
jgi:hypothetical protein